MKVESDSETRGLPVPSVRYFPTRKNNRQGAAERFGPPLQYTYHKPQAYIPPSPYKFPLPSLRPSPSIVSLSYITIFSSGCAGVSRTSSSSSLALQPSNAARCCSERVVCLAPKRVASTGCWGLLNRLLRVFWACGCLISVVGARSVVYHTDVLVFSPVLDAQRSHKT